MASSGNTRKITLTKNLKGMRKKRDGEDDAHVQSDQPNTLSKSASNSSVGSNMMKKSLRTHTWDSTASISSTGIDTQLMDQNTVLALTQDVRVFSDSLTKLHNVIHKRDASDTAESLKVATHEKLGEVLCILKTVLKKYPPVNSTDLLTATGWLITRVKGHQYEENETDLSSELHEAIDQLALAFSSSVSEFLMGDMENSIGFHHGSAQSLDSVVSGDDSRSLDAPRELLPAAKMDAHLLQMESGVELALDRAKAWSKYAKDVITYIEKRTSLEAEFTRGLSKLAMTMRPVIMENSFLPFQSIFCTALDQDRDFSNTSQAACTLIHSQKFVEPLAQRRAEHEKARKLLRDEWSKEVKKMNDAITNLKKARILYYQRSTDYEKVKDSTLKLEAESLGSSAGLAALKNLEKKKKLTEEIQTKAQEAEIMYKTCVTEANHRQSELEKTKSIILSQVRELITLCERTMKAATIAYFQLQHTVSAPAPVQYQTLCENCRTYEPGMQYSEFVRRLPNDDNIHHEAFTFEPYQTEDQKLRKQSGHSPSSKNQKINGSESESLSSGNKSGDNSPSASPYATKKLNSTTSLHPPGDKADSGLHPQNSLRANQKGHTFRKLRTPSKCRECESYVYFNGMECEKCGISCHKKCLCNLAIRCGFQQQQQDRRMTVFGVSFHDHVQSENVEVPEIVSKCIQEIDSRGLDIRGIYRVSGVKSKVERLCQSFECGGDIDLSEHHPNVISNVLKLYLRQLPEPLMTVKLYPEFVEVARNQAGDKMSQDVVVHKLRTIIDRLPPANFKTAATIIHHLKRVSECEEENQMNPSNLGIVYGPTLLRPNEGPVNLDSLMDTAHQTRAVELLITHSQALFGPDMVKLNRSKQNPSTIVEDEDSSSSASGSSVNLHSLDSNMADDILREMNKSPRHIGTSDSDDQVNSPLIKKSAGTSKSRLSDGISMDSSDSDTDCTDSQPISGVRHHAVFRSASMPMGEMRRHLNDRSALRPGQLGRGDNVLIECNPPEPHHNALPTNIHTNALAKPHAPASPSHQPPGQLFYSPSDPNKLEGLASEAVLGRRMSADSGTVAYDQNRSTGGTEKNTQENLSTRNNNGKNVFYTHSMKKKSMEPKFV